MYENTVAAVIHSPVVYDAGPKVEMVDVDDNETRRKRGEEDKE